MIDKIENVCGNCQGKLKHIQILKAIIAQLIIDMLEYSSSVNHDICLGSIVFAKLTSRTNGITRFIEDIPPIKTIAIDTFTIPNEVFLLDADSLVTDSKLLEYFNCRKQLVLRSKLFLFSNLDISKQ